MSFRKVQLSFCPQKQSKHCLKLITTQFSCPINSHFNSMICGCSINIQAMEITSLSGNSTWWKMAYIREHWEHKNSSAISHRHCNVLTSVCGFRPMMRLNLQEQKLIIQAYFAEYVCIIKPKHLCSSEDNSCAEANKSLKAKIFQPHHKCQDPQGVWSYRHSVAVRNRNPRWFFLRIKFTILYPNPPAGFLPAIRTPLLCRGPAGTYSPQSLQR